MKKYNLIFLHNSKVFLSKKMYNSWEEIQDEYEHYSTSLGFDTLDELNEYLSFDYQSDIHEVHQMTEKIENSAADIELLLR